MARRRISVREDQKPMRIPDPKHLITWLAKGRSKVSLGKGRDIRQNRAPFEAIVRAWLAYV